MLLAKWWRFTGIGGDKVSETCAGIYRGGTAHTAYISPFEYPLTESLTPKTAKAFCHVDTCWRREALIDIVICPGGFYIYRPLFFPDENGIVTSE